MTNESNEDKASDAASGRDESVVIAPVSGIITYDVRVTCPHCQRTLHLNQYPYNDEAEEFSPAEDELGEALFGFLYKPANWEKINIPYKCCRCKGDFIVGKLEL